MSTIAPNRPVHTADPAPDVAPAEPAPVRPLRAAIHSEWIKVRSIRSTPALVGVSAVLGVAMAVILGKLVVEDPYEHRPFTIATTFLVSTFLTSLLAVVAGVLSFTSEVQHGTLAGVLTSRPSPRTFVAAKTVTAATLGFVMGAVGIVTSLVTAVAVGMDAGDLSNAATGACWALVLTTMAAVLGVGVGMVVRHSAVAVTVVLVWATAFENIVRGIAPANVSRILPFSAANRLLGTRSATDTADTLAASFSNVGNALLFGGYAAATLAAGAWFLSRRDA
jgi:ABC-2 type transport system permease protein